MEGEGLCTYGTSEDHVWKWKSVGGEKGPGGGGEIDVGGRG